MQLAGPGVWGLPRDRNEALIVLREAVTRGVNHIDASDFYGPRVTNQITRAALCPYANALRIVTKVGAVRGIDKSWDPAVSADQLKAAIHDNLHNLGLEVLDVVNLRVTGGAGHGPTEGSIAAPLTTLAELQRQRMIRPLGLSNVMPAQVEEGRRIAPIVCVQNHYNLAYRHDDNLVDALASSGIAFVPFFPLGGLTPLQSSTLDEVARALDATPMQTALAWLLQRPPDILLISGASSPTHLRENLAAVALRLPEAVF